MGILNIFGKSSASSLLRLPSGSFTVDASGKIITTTIPHTFPESALKEMGHVVLDVFRGAQKAQTPLNELTVHYPALKVTAREMRGGAIIFITPKALAPD